MLLLLYQSIESVPELCASTSQEVIPILTGSLAFQVSSQVGWILERSESVGMDCSPSCHSSAGMSGRHCQSAVLAG